MQTDYLHNRPDFADLLRILEEETGIQAGLIEKDYWIMHVLYGLKKQGFNFELKGGTSLSKGYKIIDRFSEDIDLHIKPPTELNVEENPAKTKRKSIESRKNYYGWLAKEIKIAGIIASERDYTFDDSDYYRSGGIRLYYKSLAAGIENVKNGILLEAGFDVVTPNQQLTISSWAYDRAKNHSLVGIADNRAVDVTCYHPGYTFVEKLQTIATKFRQEQSSGQIRHNFMRQYYDIFCLLNNQEVQEFIGTAEYLAHKEARFPKADFNIPIQENEAFLLKQNDLRASFRRRYEDTASLYYKGQPDFEDILSRLKKHIEKL